MCAYMAGAWVHNNRVIGLPLRYVYTFPVNLLGPIRMGVSVDGVYLQSPLRTVGEIGELGKDI